MSAEPGRAAPEHLGEYALLRRLAVGGTSEVFVGHDRRDPKKTTLVVKRLLPVHLADPAMVAMFVSEAKIHRAILHPNVVRVVDTGVADGEPFLVLSFVDGIDLARLARRAETESRPMPLGLAVYVARSLADALTAVHTATSDDGRPLGAKNDDLGLELHIPTDRRVALDILPASHRNGYTALAIGAAHATKRLPPHKLITLAKAIPGPMVLIGSEVDSAVARAIGDAVGARVFDATGRFDLLGSASLIGSAHSVITHDSGAMHIACALARPVVSVWGSTVPAFGMGPYQPTLPQQAHVVEVPGLGCRPCSKLGFGHCPKGHFHCMEKQDVQRIAQLAAP